MSTVAHTELSFEWKIPNWLNKLDFYEVRSPTYMFWDATWNIGIWFDEFHTNCRFRVERNSDKRETLTFTLCIKVDCINQDDITECEVLHQELRFDKGFDDCASPWRNVQLLKDNMTFCSNLILSCKFSKICNIEEVRVKGISSECKYFLSRILSNLKFKR